MPEVIVYQAFNPETKKSFAYNAEQIQAAHNFSVLPVPEVAVQVVPVAPAYVEAPVVAPVVVPKAPKAPVIPVTINISKLLLRFSQTLAIIGVSLIIFTYAPSVWYGAQSLFANSASSFSLSTSEVRNLNADLALTKSVFLPPYDAKLPVVNHLTIPKIGVNTDIQEASLDNYEDALKKGVWRVSDFGAPNVSGKPMILAAHRFGYLAWTSFFRYKNSFANLPNVKAGDVVQIVWKQRKYTYEVYATDKATEIKDYSADLILYTCESLSGPERDFVYAKLIPA